MSSNKFKRLVVGLATAALAASAVAPLAALAAVHPVGSFVKDNTNTVFHVSPNGTLDPLTSAGAALSYGFFSWSQVMDATAEDLALPRGSFIKPRDGSLFCATETKGSDVAGECSLITGGMKAAFVSESVFKALGFSFSNAFYGDSSFLAKTTNVASGTEAHRAGVLVNNGGTVQLVGDNGLLGVPDIATFNSWGYRFVDVVPANAADMTWSQTGVMQMRQPGQLVPSGVVVGTPPPSTGSSVMVSTGIMPPSTTLPAGANSVKAAEFVFTAPSNGAITVSSLTIHRSGVGAVGDISNGYIYEGMTRLTSGRTFNTSTNDATFTVNVQIPAGMSKTLSLYVSIATSVNAGATHMFSLESASSVNATGATVAGSFPIRSNAFTLTATAAGTITLTNTGSTSNPRVGDREAEVSEFTLAASTEDAWLNSLTFTQGGNIANSALTNFKLKQSGVVVATASGIGTTSRLTLTFSPTFKIERGNSRIFELYADIDGRPADTVIFYVEESADLMATGGTYGTGMTSTVTAFDTTGEADTVTLQGGQFTITFTGPASRNISNSASDEKVWEGTVYTANTVEVRNWRVRVQDQDGTNPDLADASATAAIQDVKIWNLDNNTVIAGPKELTAGADNLSEVLVFTDTVTLNAGTTTKIGISLDVRNTPTDAAIDLLVSLNAFESNDIKNVSSNTYLTPSTDIAPNSAVPGQTQTVSAGTLTVATAPSPTDHTTVKGVSNHDTTAFNFTAGPGSNIRVNSVAVTAGASDTDDNAYGGSGAADGSSTSVAGVVLSAKLMDGTTQIGQTKTFSSGVATFDNLNWVVTKSQTKKLTIALSTNSAATLNGGTDYLRLSLETSAVSAVDENGNSATISGIAANSAEGAGDVVVGVASSGGLTATLAPDPTNPPTGLLAAQQVSKVLTAFKFESTDEAFNVKKFTLLPLVGGASSAASNDRINQLYVRYKNQAGTTVTQPVGLNSTSFTVDITSVPMYVAPGTPSYLEVLGDIADFNVLTGSEDENITFSLDADNSVAINSATGIGSNTDDNSWGSADIAGNAQYVYRTRLNVASGSSFTNTTRGAEQKVAALSLTADSTANATFRGSKKAVDGATTGWTGTGVGASATSSTAVSGSSSISHTEDGTSAVNDHFHFDFGASAGLENFNRMSFWIRSSVAKAGTGDIGISVSSTADTTDDATLNGLGTVTVNNVDLGEALTAGQWAYYETSATFVSTDRYVTFNIKANADNSSVILVDDLRFFNDKVTLDVAGNFGAATAVNGLLFKVKNTGGTVLFHGGYEGTGGGAGSVGTAVLIPGNGADVTSITTSSDVEAGTSALVLEVFSNTNTLIAADTSGVTENLSVSADTGTPSSAGDFMWYDRSDTSGSNNMAGITVANPVSTTVTYSHGY